jgi:HlyD family secretion protein
VSRAHRLRSRLAWIGIAALFITLAAFALWPRARVFELAEVRRADLVIERSDRGVTRVREVYPLAAAVNGHLERVHLEVGDRVEAGQVLARIRPSVSTPLDARSRAQAEAERRAAAALLRRAIAVDESASDLLRRREALFARDLIAEGELVALRLAEREAHAAVSAARADLARAEAALSAASSEPGAVLELAAPTEGVVLRRHLQGPQPVSAGQLILETGDPRDIEIVGDFLSQDAVEMRTGAEAIIEGWGGPPFSARVERIEPLGELKVSALGVEEQRVQVILALSEAAPALGHGYRVEVRVVVDTREDVLALPVEALQRDAESWSVWRVEDGRLSRRAVQVGASDGRFREVLEGLELADRVLRFAPGEDLEGVRVAADSLLRP